MFYTPTPAAEYLPRHHHHHHYPHSSKYFRNDSYAGSASGSTPRSHAHANPSMRRSRTLGTPYVPEYEYEYGYDPSDAELYVRMPHTYAWVLEQQIAEMTQANEDTVRWIHEQQARDSVREQAAVRILASSRRGYAAAFEELLLHPDAHTRAKTAWAESERWWKGYEGEAEYTIQEELRRLQAHRRETERHRFAYERRVRAEEEKERAHREREREAMRCRRAEAEKEAARRYEARWNELLSSSETLGFRDVPWPMFSQPRSLEGIAPAKVTSFVLSALHPGETRREKIRNALKRWHPDRFGRLSSRLSEGEKEAIEEGVGIVVRCLNDLLERENQ